MWLFAFMGVGHWRMDIVKLRNKIKSKLMFDMDIWIYTGRASDSIASKKIASNTPPPRYMPDMATAFVSHSGSLGGYGGGGTADTTKKKRGRPRKYAPDGTVAITIRPAPTPSFNPMMSSPLQKRGRGRPPGSGKKQQLAALGITTHTQGCFLQTLHCISRYLCLIHYHHHHDNDGNDYNKG